MKKIVCCLAVGLALLSCKKELEVQTPMYSSKDTATGRAPKTVAMPQNVKPVAQGQTIQVNPQQAQATQKVAPGMNPPHGQPNHRCDIPVGAPLNSPPGKVPAKAGKATASPVMIPTQSPVKTAPGMNPPHGQPGHRCDIAVGAPLNSAPAKANTGTPAASQPAEAVPAILAPTEEKKQ